MSPTSGGVGSRLCLKHLRVFLALTALQIFTAFDRWRQSQAKALICFCEQPAPQGEIVRGSWRRGELLDGNVDVSLPQQVPLPKFPMRAWPGGAGDEHITPV